MVEVPQDARRLQRQFQQTKTEAHQQTDAGTNQAGDGEAFAFLRFRSGIDLQQRDDGKNEPEDVERTPAAARHGNDAADKAGGGEAVGLGGLHDAGLRRRDDGRRGAGEKFGELRQQADEGPLARAIHKHGRLAFDAALDDPLADLFGGGRAVSFAVGADDFVVHVIPRRCRGWARRGRSTRRVLPSP